MADVDVVKETNLDEKITPQAQFGTGAHVMWWIHLMFRLALISFFAMIVYDVPNDAIRDRFYYFRWKSTDLHYCDPKDCLGNYSFEYHVQGLKIQAGSDSTKKACLDSDIYVSPYKILFEQEDGRQATLGFLGDLDKNTDEDGCNIEDDQCCDIFRVFFGTNAAVLAVFALLTLIMIIRHPMLGNLGPFMRTYVPPGHIVTILLKGLILVVYVIVFAAFMAMVQKGPRCNETRSEHENELFGMGGVDTVNSYGMLFWFSVVICVMLFLDTVGELLAYAAKDIEQKDIDEAEGVSHYGLRALNWLGNGYSSINAPIGSIYKVKQKNTRVKSMKNETQESTQSMYF
tara:strand:+ start:2242 stop:3273 length:1032 start_codon:yes stop_codon:yes gene_type:complete